MHAAPPLLLLLLLPTLLLALRGAHPSRNAAAGLSCVPRDSPRAPPRPLAPARINDDYCDCLHGEDEPGTAACPHGVFWCANAAHRPRRLASSRVDDGVCDCCDGSDEPPGACPDTCAAEAARQLAAARAAAQAIRDGAAVRARYAAEARRSSQADERELRKLERELARVQADIEHNSAKTDGLRKRKEHEDRVRSVSAEPELPRVDAVDGGARVEDGSGSVSDDALDEDDNDNDDFDALDDEMDHDIDYDDGKDDFENDSGDSEEIDKVTARDDVKNEVSEEGSDEEDYDDMFEDEDDSEEDDIDRAIDDEKPEHIIEEEENTLDADKQNEQSPQERDIAAGDRSQESDPSNESGTISDPAEEAAKVDVDTICADLGSKRPNAIARSLTYYRALVVAKLRRVLPNALQRRLVSSGSQLEDCIQKAESAKWELDSKKRDLEDKIDKLKAKSEIEYGEDGALRKLHGNCTKKKLGQYEFELCAFDLVRQYEHGSAIAVLGRFKGWEGEGPVRKMSYQDGDTCWNGPARSIMVELACGKMEDIISVDEPNRCSYSMKFETPAVCDEKAADAVMAEYQQDGASLKEEL